MSYRTVEANQEKNMLHLPPVEEAPGLNAFPVLYWNHVGLEMNRITHSLGALALRRIRSQGY